MNNKEKVLLRLWEILSVTVSLFISFHHFLFMSLHFTGSHNTSTAGDHAITEQTTILSDIAVSLFGASLFIVVVSYYAFLIHQEVCNFLIRQGRKLRGYSYYGLVLLGLDLLILCLGPVIASVSYYIERMPYFLK